MEYQNLNAEEREAITERLDLVTERIHELAAEPEVCEPFRAYFKGTAAFIVKTEEVLRQVLNDSFCSQSRETLQKINEALYEDILPEHYKESYANPDYACETLGEEYGTLLSMLYAELRSLIPYAYEGDVEPIPASVNCLSRFIPVLMTKREQPRKKCSRQFTGFSTITVNCLPSAASVNGRCQPGFLYPDSNGF